MIGKPPRMTMTNMNNGMVLSPQFNPNELEETLAANYADLSVLGMSHREQQYLHTDNLKVKFNLHFDGLAVAEAQGSLGIPVFGPNIGNARRYIHSLFYPPRAAQTILGGSPPKVLFHWPSLFSIVAKLRTAKIKHTHFANSTGNTGRFDAEIEIHEARRFRLCSEDVFLYGTIRSEAAG